MNATDHATTPGESTAAAAAHLAAIIANTAHANGYDQQQRHQQQQQQQHNRHSPLQQVHHHHHHHPAAVAHSQLNEVNFDCFVLYYIVQCFPRFPLACLSLCCFLLLIHTDFI